MRVLHVNDMASVARTLADAQTALGHPAKVMARVTPLVEPPDVVLPATTNPLLSQLAILRRIREIREADAIHIHGGIWASHLVWSYLRGRFPAKAFVVHLHGSETRTGKGLHHLRVADRVFCSTPDLLRLVPGSEWLPNPVRLPSRPSGFPAGKPILAHFPTRRAIKGTDLIRAAFRGLGATSEASVAAGITRLENQTAVLLVVEGQPHARALEIMDHCTFVIDQVNDLGIYSMVSVEGMARGKVVFSSYDPSLYSVPPPIVRLSPEGLRENLAEWLRTPESWATRGRQGRDFAERVHSADCVAIQALRAYRRNASR